jgi:hypothetical protein
VRVIVRYPGYSPELEEELYFASRVRPNEVGEQIIVPPVPENRDHQIHNPEDVNQHHRVLTYKTASIEAGLSLADKLASVQGITIELPDFKMPSPPVPGPGEDIPIPVPAPELDAAPVEESDERASD